MKQRLPRKTNLHASVYVDTETQKYTILTSVPFIPVSAFSALFFSFSFSFFLFFGNSTGVQNSKHFSILLQVLIEREEDQWKVGEREQFMNDIISTELMKNGQEQELSNK